jgi:anti-sigma factor (TIGR02949 family)
MSRLSCDQAVLQFYAYLDRALSGESLEALEEHLLACLECCDKVQFSRRVEEFMRARLVGARPPAGLEDRIRRGLALAVRSKE